MSISNSESRPAEEAAGPPPPASDATIAAEVPAGANVVSASAVAPILAVNNIEVVYDHVILVLKGVSLQVAEGDIVALLGANGAGKSTTLKAISNLLSAERGEVTKGSIRFEGSEVHALTANELVRRGCIQVMEGRHCFAHLSVEENLLTGAFTRRDGHAAVKRDLDLVYSYFPRLRERRGATAGYISGGGQDVEDTGAGAIGEGSWTSRPARGGDSEDGDEIEVPLARASDEERLATRSSTGSSRTSWLSCMG